MSSTPASSELSRSLGPWTLWGLGVGYVISGMYFGWNLGLVEGGSLGLAVATVLVMIMYVSFTLGYAELACAIPRAGGAFDYGLRAFGPAGGFLAGMAQNIEFLFAPPAIAFAIGAYVQVFLPGMPVLLTASLAYLLFTLVNISGVKAAASFELIVTVVAVIGLLLFAGINLPEVSWEALATNPLPKGWGGAFAALPFAIWFFLAIEGVANVAEETIHPQRNIQLGFGSAMATLMLLCLLTFVASVGIGGWERVVFPAGSTTASDSPLPLAMSQTVGTGHWITKLVAVIGLFGLVASFHGILLAAGRSTFEFGRVGFAPRWLGRVHPRFHTPVNALIANMVIGGVALFTGKTADIIVIACFGALMLYLLSTIALLRLRRTAPELERPFRVPGYPVLPWLTLVLVVVALVSMTITYPVAAGLFLLLLVISFGWFWWQRSHSVN